MHVCILRIDVDAALIAAGTLMLVGAGIHGIAGEMLVVRKLDPAKLEPSQFGGRRMTLAMIHVTWHLTTFAFLLVGGALVLAGSALDGDAEHAVALMGAIGVTGFAAIILGLGAASNRSLRPFLHHPAPAGFVVAVALAWLGVA
jgi:hypothetical protein